MHFIRQIVSRLAYDGRGSLCWCHIRPQPAARLRCCNVLAAWCTTSARKAHMRMALEDEVRRGVGPGLLLMMVRLLADRSHRALSRWKNCALCSQSLSLRFVVSATAPAFCIAYETIISPVTILGLRNKVYCKRVKSRSKNKEERPELVQRSLLEYYLMTKLQPPGQNRH